MIGHSLGATLANATPIDWEALTIDASKVWTLTAAKVASANAVVIRLLNGPVRFTLHGVDPVAGSIGDLWGDLLIETLNHNEAIALRMIREGATNGNLTAVYYHYR